SSTTVEVRTAAARITAGAASRDGDLPDDAQASRSAAPATNANRGPSVKAAASGAPGDTASHHAATGNSRMRIASAGPGTAAAAASRATRPTLNQSGRSACPRAVAKGSRKAPTATVVALPTVSR